MHAINFPGSPVEERRPFPNLNDLGSALPYVPPPMTNNTCGQREPQEQGDMPSIVARGQPSDLRHTAASNQPPSQGASASPPRFASLDLEVYVVVVEPLLCLVMSFTIIVN